MTVDTFGPDQCRNLWVTRFLGTPAVQYWSDFMVWDRFLNAFPARRLIELGTGPGGLSLYLALQCRQRGMMFDTFDTFLPEVVRTPVAQVLSFESRCHVANIWNEGFGVLRGMLATSEHPVILLCDNGDKPREVRLYLPMLQAGDFLAVHDWQNEFTDADIPAELRHRVQVIFAAESEQLGTMTRFYQVVA